MLIDETKAEELLRKDLRNAEQAVEQLVTVSINDNQFSALVSFAFNVGAGALEESTLLSLLNTGTKAETVAAQFLWWNKAGDEELPGLTRRRHAERSLFLEPIAPSNFAQI